MTKYVVAVRRELRDRVGRDWSAPLGSIEDLEIVGAANPYRLRVEATEPAIELARARVGRICHIEPVQARYVLATKSGYGR